MICFHPSTRFLFAAGLALLLASFAAADDKDPLKLDNVPKFAGTTTEPVLLRYKAKAGEVEKIVVNIDIDILVSIAGQKITMKQVMGMEAKAKVTEVDATGNISLVVKLTRMTLKMTGQATVEFDSDKPPDNEEFKPVMAMIGIGIPCKVSPVGKMLETDLEPLRLAARRLNNAALAKTFEDSTKKMFEETYIELSEKPVKTGDTYKSGTVLCDNIKTHKSFRIRAVSGDKTQAILEPVAEIELIPGGFPAGTEAKLKSQKMAGWILFDVQKGYASKQDIRAKIVLEISGMGQSGTVDTTIKVTSTSSVE